MKNFDFTENELKELELFQTYNDKFHTLFDIFSHNNFDFEKLKMKKLEDEYFFSNKKEIVLKTKTIGTTKLVAFLFFALSFGMFSNVYTQYTDTERATLIASVLQFSIHLTTLSDNFLTSHHIYHDISLIDNFFAQFRSSNFEPEASAINIHKGHVYFQNVSFFYGNKQILRNFSCEFFKGVINCIVGKSGLGKSTIVHMISGFHDTYSGVIAIDGFSIRKLNLHSIRENISICGQNSFVQSSTIRENLIYGHPIQYAKDTVQTQKINQILRKYDLLDYFDIFQNKLETRISPISISGGQKQMINFCRVLIRNTKIMIFDEPTSALNYTLSLKCVSILEKVALSKTVILITHNPLFHKKTYNIIDINTPSTV